MDESQGKAAAGWKRATDFWKRTERGRAGAQIPLVIISHTAGQLAQAHLDPVTDPPAIRREIDLDEQKQYADWELEHLREQADQTEPELNKAKPEQDREPRSDRQAGNARSRDRQRDR